MNAAETHETIHWKSGMRYQVSSRLDFERESAFPCIPVPLFVPLPAASSTAEQQSGCSAKLRSLRKGLAMSASELASSSPGFTSAITARPTGPTPATAWRSGLAVRSAVGVRRPIWMPCGMP
jgi:hypothetical protein